MISMYEEQYAFGKNKPVLQEKWSKAAREALITACAAVAAANGWMLVLLSTDDLELRDMAQLYNAVDFSIQRHALVVKGKSKELGNLFPEKIRYFDYTLGPSQGAMELNKVDAVWMFEVSIWCRPRVSDYKAFQRARCGCLSVRLVPRLVS